jgi:ABC-type branched-subunit amino acid transport system substrate-binding protein
MSRISSFANEIDGIYAPISDRNDAMIILSQMVQRGLSTKIYGNQDWFIAKGFETSPELSNNLIFESDYFLDFNDLDLKNFSSQFKKLSGIDVNRNVLYGYDLAKYLLTVMRNINPTRKNIKYKIESGISVTGYHNNISFNEDRVNKFINVIRFKDGIFELVDKFKSGN